MPLQWFDKLNPGSIRGWEDLQRASCENFVGIITHPITQAELKGLKQKGGESLRDYYRCFGELHAQVHDITEREVIEAFSHGIMAKWQFQDFCKENPRNNKEFRCTVEKMIMAEEKTRERLPDRNNRENNRDNSDMRTHPKIRTRQYRRSQSKCYPSVNSIPPRLKALLQQKYSTTLSSSQRPSTAKSTKKLTDAVNYAAHEKVLLLSQKSPD
jgi:hypothetical protein